MDVIRNCSIRAFGYARDPFEQPLFSLLTERGSIVTICEVAKRLDIVLDVPWIKRLCDVHHSRTLSYPLRIVHSRVE